MRYIFLLLMVVFAAKGYSQHSAIVKHRDGCRMEIDGESFLMLGGELGNSSASSAADIERIFPKLGRMGLNTVLVPAYWDMIEPQEGVFDFALTNKAIEEARKNNLRIVFLWFGAWKNSMSCYAPDWFKKDCERFPRAHTSTGRALEIASVFSENVFRADNNAFSQWLRHIASIDKEQGTVIMIQIENEIGMLEEARDHSAVADSLFAAPVPDELVLYMRERRATLTPHLLQRWESGGSRISGSWAEMFGNDIYTDELFMAWYYGVYVERMARSARAIYDIPLYVNAAMNSRGRLPGQYPSAGPLAHLIDVWRCAAPSIDMLSPDIYDDGFKGWVAQYHTADNPLFIPECKATENNGVRALYAFGEHDALGFSPFSIEDCSDSPSSALVRSYSMIASLRELITFYQCTGSMDGLLFTQKDSERVITVGDRKLVCRHAFTLPWDSRATDGSEWPEGGGVVIRINADEYLLAGSGVVVEFMKADAGEEKRQLGEDGFLLSGEAGTASATAEAGERIGLLSVEEVLPNEDGTFRTVRRLNGDQTHQGRHARISVDDFKILHIRLYTYK